LLLQRVVQEMLIQSYAGFIEIFPAVPTDWKEVSFTDLRAEGAFLVSAVPVRADSLDEVVVQSEKGGSSTPQTTRSKRIS
jgi:alpha-L-fucosidase 2